MSRPTFVAALVCALPLCVPTLAQPGWTEFTFSKMNTAYESTDADVAWSSEGAVKVHVTSPEHRLEVLEHDVRLRPLGNGLYDLRSRVRFRGEGEIDAKVDALGSAGNMSDHVVIPEQEVEVAGTLRLVPLEGGDVRVFAVELPKTVKVEIESGLGQQLYAICNITLAILTGADCRLLEGAFTSARVPMPEPGTSTTLTAEQMTSVEAVRLHGWVTATQDG